MKAHGADISKDLDQSSGSGTCVQRRIMHERNDWYALALCT